MLALVSNSTTNLFNGAPGNGTTTAFRTNGLAKAVANNTTIRPRNTNSSKWSILFRRVSRGSAGLKNINELNSVRRRAD